MWSPARRKRRRDKGSAESSSSLGAMLCEQILVEPVESFHHLFDGEIRLNKLAASFTEFGAQFRIASQQQDAFCGSVLVAVADKEAGLIIEADLVGAVVVVGDDGFAGGEGLGQGAGQRFAARKVDEAIHDANVPRHFTGR